MATSVQNSENVLQALLNNPTQLQRLLATFAAQQNMPLSTPPESSSSAFNPYSSPTYQSFSQPASTQIDSNPLFRTNDNNSLPLALTFQPSNDLPSFAPGADTSSQLQKAHRDAETISADVESLQASIDTLLENLGLDPESVKELGESHHIEDPILPSTTNGTNSPKLDPVVKYQPPHQEFDIDKFLSEWDHRQANLDESGQPQPLSIIDGQGLDLTDPSDHLEMDTLINNATTQPNISSLTAATSIAGNNTVEESSNPKRGRKRKSQVMEGSDDYAVRKGLSERK